jgi:hypothetical protein
VTAQPSANGPTFDPLDEGALGRILAAAVTALTADDISDRCWRIERGAAPEGVVSYLEPGAVRFEWGGRFLARVPAQQLSAGAN